MEIKLKGLRIGWYCLPWLTVIAAQAADYFPPAESRGGWRKNTNAEFVQSLGIDPVKAKGFVDYWAGLRKDQTSLIIKDGWIVAEAGPGQDIRLASNGKAISMALFGVMLKNRGTQNIPSDLSIDSKVYDKRWLPQGFPLSDRRKRQITFLHLFRHTSGIQPEGLRGSDRGGDRDLLRYGVNKQMKIASFLAMTTVLIAHGRNEGHQHKNSGHCEDGKF